MQRTIAQRTHAEKRGGIRLGDFLCKFPPSCSSPPRIPCIGHPPFLSSFHSNLCALPGRTLNPQVKGAWPISKRNCLRSEEGLLFTSSHSLLRRRKKTAPHLETEVKAGRKVKGGGEVRGQCTEECAKQSGFPASRSVHPCPGDCGDVGPRWRRMGRRRRARAPPPLPRPAPMETNRRRRRRRLKTLSVGKPRRDHSLRRLRSESMWSSAFKY